MSVPAGKWPINCANINISFAWLCLGLVALHFSHSAGVSGWEGGWERGSKSLTAAIKILNLAHKSLVLRDMANRS